MNGLFSAWEILRTFFRDKDRALTVSITLMSVAMATAGIIVAVKKDPWQIEKLGEEQIWIVSFASLPIALGFVMLTLRYLSGSSLRTSEIHEEEFLWRTIKELKRERQLVFEGDIEGLRKQVLERVRKGASEQFLGEIEQRLEENRKIRDVQRRVEKTLNRIYTEIDALGRRGALNLVIGILTASTGVTILGILVLGKGSTPSTVLEFTMTFLPRLSLVVILELFSYFFLRLYKAGLDEIKYFQNEATNIELKVLALEVSLDKSDQVMVSESIKCLLATERNAILPEGVSTKEIKALEALDKNFSLTPKALVELVQAVSKKS